MKIPKVNKFKGEINNRLLITWIAEFKAHARVLGINQNKWRDTLFCCTESTAFTFIATKILEDETITYNL